MSKCKHDIICINDGLISKNVIYYPTFKCKKCLKLFNQADDNMSLEELKIKED